MITGRTGSALNFSRRVLPANQVESFSHGRGMPSDYDMRLTFYPSDSGDPVGLLFDPRAEQTFLVDDVGSDGSYSFEHDIYYRSIKLEDAFGNPVGDPATASGGGVVATVTRRNGWVYRMEVCPTPLETGEYCSRVKSITSPQGHQTVFTHKSFTQSQIDSSPSRQLQIDTITDADGNVAQVSYNGQQQGGQWVISQVNINSGEAVLGYSYNASGLLASVSRNGEVTSSYTYGFDSAMNAATLEMSERRSLSKDQLLLSPDYQNGDGTVVNQYSNILQGKRNGANQTTSMVYRDPNNVGWYKLLYEGRMAEVKLGESVRWYTSYTENPLALNAYDRFTGTLEPTYTHATGLNEDLIMTAQPPVTIDSTGYSVSNTYDANGNLTRVTHPDGTFERFEYDANNQVTYQRDRAGFVRLTERDSNENIVRVVRGMRDAAGNGTVTSTPEAVQEIYGFYPPGHVNAGLMQWSSTTPYSGASFSAPPANTRTDYIYNANQKLVKMKGPIPHGQSARPETTYTWVGNFKTSETSPLGHTMSFQYDALGRLTQTLYADGTTAQTYYDDVNNTVYQKDRVGVVSVRVTGPSGRLSATHQGYGKDSDISDGTVDQVNQPHEIRSTAYFYQAGYSTPTSIYRGASQTVRTLDYRGRVVSTITHPNSSTQLETQNNYVDNQMFYSTQKVGTYEVRTYYGHSADRQTVRTIETRKPGVSFTNNNAVLNATRLTGADPDYIINDAIRDIRGQIVQVIDPLGITGQTTYDAVGRATIQSRSKGGLTLASQTTYDSDGNVIESTNEAGVVTAMTYDDANNLVTRTVGAGTPLALTTAYTYTIDGKLETVTAPDGGVTTTVNDTCCGYTVGIKDPLGHGSVTNSNSAGQSVHTAVLADYDSHSNLLDPLDSKTLSETTSRYDDNGKMQFRTVWKSPLGAVDRSDPPIAGIDGVAATDGVTTQYVYDELIYDDQGLDSPAGLTIDTLGGGTAQVSIKAAVDKLAQSVANGGALTSFASGSSATASVVISPDEQTMQVTINDGTGRGVMTALMSGPKSTTPNQLINWTCNRYDQIDNTSAGIPTLSTASVDVDGNTTTSLTDGFGRSVASIDQLGNVSSSQYDSGGNMLKSIDALGRETNYAYDGLARQITITDALGNPRGTVYDTSTGRVASTSDAKGNSTSQTYDALGRVKTVTDRTGKVTTNTYDNAGRLETITDAENRITTYGYDLKGQRTSTTLADNSARASVYDAAGRVVETLYPSGKSRKNFYAFSGVVDKVEYRNAAGALTGTDTFGYDDFLRRTSSNSRYGVANVMQYDYRGLMVSNTTTYAGKSYPVGYQYDDRGRLEEITYPSGRKATYTFEERSLLDTIAWAGQEIEDRNYNELGLLIGITRAGSAVDETRSYDNLNRVTSIANTNVGTGSYSYDANGNKLSESWSGAMSAWNFTTQSGSSDGYDDEDRFVNFIQPTKNKTVSFTRSNIGNISNVNLNGTNTNRGYSNTHELSSIGNSSQSFDDDGNLTQSHTDIDLDWDEGGMLKQTIVGPGDTTGIEGTNEYGYDADGKRAWKKITRGGSVAEHSVYIYAGPNCIAEYSSGANANSPSQEYVHAQAIDSLVMLVRNGGSQKLNVTRNQQWSITALSNSSNGSIVERYTYDEFGKRTILAPNGSTVRTSSSYNNPYGYTSRRHDSESGLIYFRARYYDSTSGEFTSQDPLEYLDGMSLYRGYFVPEAVDSGGLIKVNVTAGYGWGRHDGLSCGDRYGSIFHFELSRPEENTKGGYLIQRILWHCEITNCCNREEHDEIYDLETYELLGWDVNGGKIPAGKGALDNGGGFNKLGDRNFIRIPKDKDGVIITSAEVRFIPATPAIDAEVKNWKLGVEYGEGDCKVFAEHIKSNKSFSGWDNFSETEGTPQRTLLVGFDCCPNATRKKVVGATAEQGLGIFGF